MSAIPITYVLFTLGSLRRNELYPCLPAAANYVIAAAYCLFHKRAGMKIAMHRTAIEKCFQS